MNVQLCKVRMRSDEDLADRAMLGAEEVSSASQAVGPLLVGLVFLAGMGF
ncbi:hypothetical protein J2Y69_000363 [Microbacterium resistens]|uniref:Uncharacterized protein n=1 Tax=Microbacterium resistens TaxID=156977 RepID=A0ABU1S837_9MICO|nr:hypothetical protein [Microbacterium resistens]MDR6865781.1 hypothetical protein [Microbacterium resistens]